MNRVAAIFTSVYTVIKKACRGVKNNYDTSQDEGKILWTYLAQLVACLFGIGICIFIFIVWTDHQEEVCVIDVQNHKPYISNDSCYVSFFALTGEAYKGATGEYEHIWYEIETKKNIDKRYSRDDIERMAKSRKIDINKDSITQDSCTYILTFNSYLGLTTTGNGFYKRVFNSSNEYYRNYIYTNLFASRSESYFPKDSIPRLGLSRNKNINYSCARFLYSINRQKPDHFDSVNALKLGGAPASRWYRRGDLSTLNYYLNFELSEIDLDKIHIQFKTPTIINSIYPEPDVLDLYNLEYTDPTKLAHIQKNGLSYEMEFVSGKSLQDFRMNVLIMVMSILITYVLSILYRVIVILCKSDRISKRQIKKMFLYPIGSFIVAIIVGKIVNLIYAPWTKFAFIIAFSLTIYDLVLYLWCLVGSFYSNLLRVKEYSIYFLWISFIMLTNLLLFLGILEFLYV